MVSKLQSARWRRTIPQNPGIYFFKSDNGKILYIGKAGNLRARLGSYFREAKLPLGSLASKSAKTASLVKEAAKVEWEILNSEVEALIKESELIKKHRPKYNVLMRDDKNYFYVGFTSSTSSGQAEKFPKVFLTHQPQKPPVETTPLLGKEGKGVVYIGPFTEGASLKSVLKTLRRPFPYCACYGKPHKRLCLNARLGKCLGFCCIDQSKLMQSPSSPSPLLTKERGWGEVYKKNITAIKKVLSGKSGVLTRELKKEMIKLSKSQKYEEAGKIRNQIRALVRIFEHRGVLKHDLPSENQKALNSLETILGVENINRMEAYDIANIGGKFAYGSMAVFEDGKIKKDDYRIFKINSVQSSNDPAMLREVLSRRLNHPEWRFPDVIIIDGGKPQLGAVANVLKTLAKAQVLREHSQRDGARQAIRQQANMRVPAKFGAETKLIALTKNKKHVGDHIFINGRANPMPMDRLPPPLKNMILHLDSEAHRFAIGYYRRLHKKALLT